MAWSVSPPMQRVEQIEAAAAVSEARSCWSRPAAARSLSRALHECSAAARGPFVALNCAAVSRQSRTRSGLFGHKRGAFSGATGDYAGLFRAAEGGTLCPQMAITEMSAESPEQASARDTGAHRPAGRRNRRGSRQCQAGRLDQSRDPQAATREGRLREDLYSSAPCQRSAGTVAARTARGHSTAGVDHFVELFNERLERRIPIAGVEPEALEALQRHLWPGNARELANVMRGRCSNSSDWIGLKDLPEAINERVQTPLPSSPKAGLAPISPRPSVK